MKTFPDGLIAVVKHDCQTCRMIQPVMTKLAGGQTAFTVLTQDDPEFLCGVTKVINDTKLAYSYQLNIEVVPTLMRVENGREINRIIGWNRKEWRQFTGIADLGQDLPEQRPGCGARNMEPEIAEKLAWRYQPAQLKARRIEIAAQEDDLEACFRRGWTDGLPVVLTAVEAACMDAFCMHGLLATTYFSGPVVIVNGPIAKAIGMNAGLNVFGRKTI